MKTCKDFGINKCGPCKKNIDICAVIYCKNTLLHLPKDELINNIIDCIKNCKKYFNDGSSIYLECAIKEYYSDKNLFETVKLLM